MAYNVKKFRNDKKYSNILENLPKIGEKQKVAKC